MRVIYYKNEDLEKKKTHKNELERTLGPKCFVIIGKVWDLVQHNPFYLL